MDIHFILFHVPNESLNELQLLSFSRIDDNNKEFFVLIETKLPSYNELLLRSLQLLYLKSYGFKRSKEKILDRLSKG